MQQHEKSILFHNLILGLLQHLLPLLHDILPFLLRRLRALLCFQFERFFPSAVTVGRIGQSVSLNNNPSNIQEKKERKNRRSCLPWLCNLVRYPDTGLRMQCIVLESNFRPCTCHATNGRVASPFPPLPFLPLYFILPPYDRCR